MKAPLRELTRMLCALIGALSVFATNVHAQLPAGRVVAWGDAFWGQTNVPPTATNVVAISARGDANIALKADGQVLVWPLIFAVPPAAANSIAVAAGVSHYVALRADGRVIAWGAEDSGQ